MFVPNLVILCHWFGYENCASKNFKKRTPQLFPQPHIFFTIRSVRPESNGVLASGREIEIQMVTRCPLMLFDNNKQRSNATAN
jgi:hypothetical protein